MKKIIKKTIIIIILVPISLYIIFYAVLFYLFVSSHKSETKVISEVVHPCRKYKIQVNHHSDLGVFSAASYSIFKIDNNGKKSFLAKFESYDKVEHIEFINDDSLLVIHGLYMDTLYLGMNKNE